MSERGVQVSVARARAGVVGARRDAAAPAIAVADVLVALRDVPDPELPMVSVVDLGMIGDVTVAPATGDAAGTIRVELLPTFVGCPALEIIRGDITTHLASFGRPVEVQTVYRPPWTTERISADGLRALAGAGIAAPPGPAAPARCPWCGSVRTVMDSAFGPTQCRSLHYCRECRQPFEALRPV